MTCEELTRLLDRQTERSGEEAALMARHLEACESCRERVTLQGDLKRLDEGVEAPVDFAPAWRRLIREETHMEKGAQKKRTLRNWLAAAAAVAFLIVGTVATRDMWLGAPSANKTAESSVYDAPYGQAGAAMPMLRSAGVNAGAEDGMALKDMAEESLADVQAAKIIRTANFTLKTEAFDAAYDALVALAKEMGGRVEYSSLSGDKASGTLRTARLTLRIPTERLDDFLERAAGAGEVTGMTQSATDVSVTYYDLQARLDAQNAKMKRLIELMDKADSVGDLIEVESAIADTQYLIDSYQSSLKGYDSRVEDSEVSVVLREVSVSQIKTSTLGDRMSQALDDSVKGFVGFLNAMLVFIVAALPWLLAAAVIVVALVLIVKKRSRTKKQ